MRVRRLARMLARRRAPRLHLEGVEQRLCGLEGSERRLSTELSEFSRIVAAEFAAVRTQLEQLSDRAGQAEQREAGTASCLNDLRSSTETTIAEVGSLRAELSDARRRADATGRVLAATAWFSAIEVPETVTISVIMATRNRAERLERAVRSVRAQVYGRWELVVVDDGSTDGTSDILARLGREDDRIVVVTREHRGVASARNAGLARATGSVICYLDDDNVMQPLWLKAVAWAFSTRPGLEVLYGALATAAPGPQGDAGVPWLVFEPFDRELLERANFIDSGTIAHLRGLPEAYHDEDLLACVDWDLILRLTRRAEPLALPVIALAYTVDAPGRISNAGHGQLALTRIRQKTRLSRPLRILAFNSIYPVVTESYIEAELNALTSRGAVMACCSTAWQPSPVNRAEPLFADLVQAVDSYQPDMLLLHWATFARDHLDLLGSVGVPFAVRVHSFDSRPDVIAEVRRHPLCLGVWAHPHQARKLPGTHPLVNLIAHRGAFPEPEEHRPVVLAACAGLPKKDWPTLVDAFARLAEKGADCRLIIGITSAFEEEPSKVRAMIREKKANISLSVDVPHDQVRALLARTAVVVYTKDFAEPLGMPTSIIEGMLSATSVILPDEPEAELIAGPACRTYRTADDIVRHATEVLAGGEAILDEQAFNRRWAEERYADPALADAFYDQLAAELERWRTRHGWTEPRQLSG